ncbi:Dcm methylase [Serratia fonticola]|uniref:Dcm methylase n=1 Tax=Serratia fonticola TaxID=47917 RepID=UPI0008FD0133|nr:Dcm methylase [Serratia fonticola]OIX95912.1 Dcm methylase [Serratia fonticola]QCR61158.1 Dcm methylase [Serratia fonticola]
MKKAIFLFDFTGFMAQPWLEAGYECWCFDGQHEDGITRDGNHVKVGMWFSAADKLGHAKAIAEMVGDGISVVFGFPECTNLTVAGARYFETKRAENPLFQIEAAELADLVRIVGLVTGAAWAFENPVGVLSSMYRKPDFAFNPCDYAGYLPENDSHPLYPDIYPARDRYNKTTHIWCGGGFVRPESRREEPEFKANPGWRLCGGKSTRTKNIRSATPRGFARAVFMANTSRVSSAGCEQE